MAFAHFVDKEIAPPQLYAVIREERALTYYVQMDGITHLRNDCIGYLALILPRILIRERVYGQGAVVFDNFILSLSASLWPLKNQWMEMPVYFEKQVRSRDSNSWTVVLATWMMGSVIRSVDKQWRGPAERPSPSNTSASSQVSQNKVVVC